MNSQDLFHVMSYRLTATRVSKIYTNFIFMIKKIHKIHSRLFNLEDEGTTFLRKDANYRPFDTTLHPNN
jgi:hypothetical protein